MNRVNRFLLGALAISASVLVGCASRSQMAERGAAAPDLNPRRPVMVHVFDAQVSPQTTNGDLLIPTALSVEDTALVLAEREGRIIELRGQEGARVTKGEVMARFNDDDQRSQLHQAELEVNRLQVEEQQYEALVKLNRSELDREASLAEQGVSSKADVERARYKLDQAVKEHEKTRLATEEARARLETVRLELEKSTVRAPITGVISRRYIALGTNVARNDKLFEVSKLFPLQVKFQIPQTAKVQLAPGQIVSLSLANSDSLVARARVRRSDPIADATSHTVGYLADVMSGPGLVPGLAVNIHLPGSSGGLSFWIPRTAFLPTAELRGGGSGTLFVVEGEKVVSRQVTISSLEGDQVQVISGLAKDDRVVLMPPVELKDGDVVEINRG